jgi:protein-disulfide isomerase
MRSLLAAMGLLASLALAAPAHADEPAFTPAQRAAIVGILREALKSDPSILRDAISALQDDEANIKQAAARAAIGKAGPSLTQAQGDPVAGNPNGDVTVVEFYDVRCPYCRKMLPVVAELLRDDPKIRLIYKDIPILGPASVVGAKAVLAAQRQGGYQKLHDIIMAGPPTVTEDSLHTDATRAGLDWERLQRDMADPVIEKRLDENLSLARALGIDGTPAYVIGAKLLPGAIDLADLQDAVTAARAH